MNGEAQIRAFYLADPLIWVANSDMLKKTILQALQINPSEALVKTITSKIDFNIDPLCGHIRCHLYHDLWYDSVKANVMQLNKDKVEKSATDFIKSLIDLCKKEDYTRSKIPPILPAQYVEIKFQDSYLVPHHSKPWIDHWLCRFLVYIAPTEKEVFHQTPQEEKEIVLSTVKVPVMGSNIDVRIGNNGKVVGFESFWRPTFLEHKKVTMLAFDPTTVESMGHEHGKQETVLSDKKHAHRPLVYVLDGAQSPQNILAPYYLKQVSHASYYFPASDRSIEIDFYQEIVAENSVNVHALVSGGSGDYSFHWSGYNLTDDLLNKDAIKLYGEGIVTNFDKKQNSPARSSLQVETGIYNLILIIGDNQTGVIRQKQVTVCTNIVQKLSEQEQQEKPTV